MTHSLQNGVRLDDKDRFSDASVSGFTAVNGRSPTHTLKLSGNGSERRHSRAEVSPASDHPPQDKRHSDRPSTPRPPERDSRLSSPGKRKRSLSDDNDDDDLDIYSRRTSRGPRGDRYTADDSSSDDDDDDVEPLDNDNRDSPLQPGDFNGPSQLNGRPVDARPGDEDRGAWYARSRLEASGRSGGQYAEGDGQSMDSAQRQLDITSTDYSGTTEITRAGVQVDVKKRKRNFSNRTKTGCLTCRRRKKKCDEAKPECNNCTRGGFVCEGYLMKSPWMKPGLAKNHVPLQSKHGYAEHPGIYPKSYPEPRPVQSIEGPQTRAVVVDNDRSSASNPWAPWHTAQERVVHHEFPRTVAPSHGLYSERSSYVSTPHAMPPSQHVSSSQSAMTAQLALQHQSSTTLPRTPQAQSQSEKEKMLSGQYFLPFSPQLIQERRQCKAALWRFNNAMNPAFEASPEERVRLFRAVLEPPHARMLKTGPTPAGNLGKDVEIEAPFYCEYGYNIVIGDDVVIGTECTIIDAQRVKIGSRTVLGSNVKIYTMDYNSKERKGSKGTAVAEEVRIGEGVIIGSDVTILAGAVIHDNSTIDVGSMVTRRQIIPHSAHASGEPAVIKTVAWKEPPSYTRAPTR